MARIKTNAEHFGHFNAVDNLAYLLERSADFASLARHGFKQNCGFQILSQNRIERVDNKLYTLFHALLYVRAGMKIIIISGKHIHPFKIIRERLARETADILVRGARV